MLTGIQKALMKSLKLAADAMGRKSYRIDAMGLKIDQTSTQVAGPAFEERMIIDKPANQFEEIIYEAPHMHKSKIASVMDKKIIHMLEMKEKQLIKSH